mmetsp:Transcript_20833/g.29123  ORF Transcript_20833/g.29123 Transcript_20833/m.29123 type:complete len:103 (-) Transcript_20833:858-1166(-)
MYVNERGRNRRSILAFQALGATHPQKRTQTNIPTKNPAVKMCGSYDGIRLPAHCPATPSSFICQKAKQIQRRQKRYEPSSATSSSFHSSTVESSRADATEGI